jgi:predicted DsbA family dithiol-disulfide isomerase
MMLKTLAEWDDQQVSKLDLFGTFPEEHGLDTAASDQTVADTATTTRIGEDVAEGNAMQVRGTSMFCVDGEKRELNSLTDVTDVLSRAIAN